MLVAAQILPSPDALKDPMYDRFLPLPVDSYEPSLTTVESSTDGLDRLDPSA
jgi:hypothetical protein